MLDRSSNCRGLGSPLLPHVLFFVFLCVCLSTFLSVQDLYYFCLPQSLLLSCPVCLISFSLIHTRAHANAHSLAPLSRSDNSLFCSFSLSVCVIVCLPLSFTDLFSLSNSVRLCNLSLGLSVSSPVRRREDFFTYETECRKILSCPWTETAYMRRFK